MSDVTSGISPRLRARQWLKLYYHRSLRMYRTLRRIQKKGCYLNRKYLIDEQRRIIYVANSKVASSSIKASISGIGEIENYRDVNRILRDDGNYLSDIDLDAYSGYYSFSFVRNPFARLASCYTNKCLPDPTLPKGQAQYFDYYLMGYLAKNRNFAAFARKVCRIPDKWADRHFAAQCFLLEDQNGNRTTDFVGRMEDLPDAYEPIRARFDLAPLPHHNKSGGRKENWMDMYDLKTAQAVYQRYRRDIEQFGYADAYEKLLSHIREKT